MAHQEMTYSPAYYHWQDRVVAVDPQETYPSSPQAAYIQAKQNQLPLTEPYPAYRSPASQASSPEAPSTLSESSRESYLSGKVFAEPIPPTPGHRDVSAAPFMLSPHVEEGSITNLTSRSNECTQKENGNRSSWGDQRSYVSGENNRHSGLRLQSRVSVYAGIEEEEEAMKSDGSQNALLLLLHMSISIPILSLCTCMYAMFSLLFVVVFSPLRLCPPTSFFRSTSFPTQLCHLLVPVLLFQEGFVQSRKPRHRQQSSQGVPSRLGENDPYRSTPLSLTDSYSAVKLLYVLLLAPFLSFGLLLAAWTAAFFWVFAMIMGNPDGTERRDDGRAAVLGVANWWRKWLNRARRTP